MDNQRRGSFATIWTILASALTLGVLFFTFRGIDAERFAHILQKAAWIWILVLILVMPMEQLVRGWKWRQILIDIRPVSSLRLFGAVMAGYFANMVVPVGVSPLVRAWLVARKEELEVSTVLVTTAIERFVDGIVFAVLVGILIALYALPDMNGNLRIGLSIAASGSFFLFAGLFVFLFRAKSKIAGQQNILGRMLSRLEKRFSKHLSGLATGISEGIVWPNSIARGVGIVSASILMKVISLTHFLWAGLAFGIVLGGFDYLFVMIFSGFSLILTRFVRVPGGGLVGSAIALKMLGIPDEEVLTMVALVHTVSVATTVAVGAPVLWYDGLKISAIRQSV